VSSSGEASASWVKPSLDVAVAIDVTSDAGARNGSVAISWDDLKNDKSPEVSATTAVKTDTAEVQISELAMGFDTGKYSGTLAFSGHGTLKLDHLMG
jgi:hypothetical protein